MTTNQLSLQEAEALNVTWIKNNDSLALLLDELEQCEEVAFDTEFIKRDTYYAKLALIQINTGKHIYLLDAPELDLTDFWQVLADLPVMIWHACGEDLSIFYLLSDTKYTNKFDESEKTPLKLPLDNVFDTQIGLAFLTDQFQMGYQQAVESELGIHLDKGHSQSDWLARPLTDEQEQYAVDDVRYLLPLYYRLKEQLQQSKKSDLSNKVWADCQLYASDIYHAGNIGDDEQYLSAADFRNTGKQLWMLRELLSWREKLVHATNQPRTFILRKQAIREIAEHMPTSMRKLGQTSIHRSVIKMYGEEIIEIVRQAEKADPKDYPTLIVAPYRSKNKMLKKLIDGCINEQAEKIGISSNVFMKKKWLSQLFETVALQENTQPLRIDDLPKGLQGWRADFICNTLVPLLQDNVSELKAGMGLS